VQPTPSPSPAHPNLQSQLLDDRFKTSTSPLAKIDFKNYSYPLPRGWHFILFTPTAPQPVIGPDGRHQCVQRLPDRCQS